VVVSLSGGSLSLSGGSLVYMYQIQLLPPVKPRCPCGNF